MNRILSIIILLIFISCKTEDKKILKEPRVDKRVELLNIVFRLAGSHEYSSKAFSLYAERIENHFEQYKTHELIKFTRDSIRTKGISFGTVMSMAINITEPPQMKPNIEFTEDIPGGNWDKKSALKFINLLNQFYYDSKCELFFNENEDLYKTASKRFLDIYNEIDDNWYKEFYGENHNQEFTIINGLSNGGCNYGVKTKNAEGKELIYAIMGTWTTDSLNLPVYRKEEYFPTLIHEFNHSFVNPNVENHSEILFPSGSVILEHLQKILMKQAYTKWKPMYFEALVRASVVKYLKDHNYDDKYVQSQLTSEINLGFVWTGELVEELDRYSRNRDKYPSFNNFMPEIAKFFDLTADNIEGMIQDVDARRPRVLNISPFKNRATDVSPQIQEVQINFNKVIEVDNLEKLVIISANYKTPEINNLKVSDDNKSILIKFNLEPNQNYKIVLKGKFIKTLDGYNPKNLDNIEIEYSTK